MGSGRTGTEGGTNEQLAVVAATSTTAIAVQILRISTPPPPPTRWTVDDAALGDGYGIPTADGQEAISLLARTEGVLLDPVYTAKAFGHLVAQVRRDELDPDRDVVFLHTGGSPGLFAYAPEWSSGDR